ncbi:hypothetical protein TIFTF001_002729 [Ficus carica]|uniref:RING-type E3 ubiquitin transferase n=1 Tax=Ficus carica TaxID=3494 RepID=A0AA88CU08_FICCA|nr:hypothetical protein TIFTF001_002729 [Ficus carica]
MFISLTVCVAVENVRSSRNPSIQIEDNMIDFDDDDSDWSSYDESEDEDAVDISYEERRAMREQTRDANNRLSEAHIATNLSRRTYQSATGTSTDHRDELQEEYGEGEQIAGLECGHEFHYNCIKQWLIQNNSCPICKRIGLTVGRS